MTDANIEDRVESWLNKTGFPLEMRVAKAFRKAEAKIGWYVETNTYYIDDLTGAAREIDLDAYSHFSSVGSFGIDIGGEIVVECKSTSPPWVVMKDAFDEPHSPMFQFGSFSSFTVQNLQRPGQLDEFCQKLDAYLGDRLPAAPRPGYGMAEAFKDSNARDVSYAASQQVLSAVRSGKKNYYDGDPDLSMAVFIPVVVTTSPLFEAALSDSTGRIEVRAVDRAAVQVTTDGGRQYTVHIFNDKALDLLISDIEPLNREIAAFLELFDRRILKEEEGVVATQRL